MRWILLVLLVVSCSGYRYTQQDNPLSQYGINSLSIPMFHNYSNQPDVAPAFTRETYRLLSGFSGLRLSSGYNPNSDALLLGIVKSPEKIALTMNPQSLRVAQDRAGEAIGATREKFYIPGTTDVQLYVQVVVIKKPTEEELALLKSGIGDQVKLTSKIIFNETIPLRTTFAREVFDKDKAGTVGIDPVNVTATQNAGLRRKTMASLAEQTAINIRDMILYAF